MDLEVITTKSIGADIMKAIISNGSKNTPNLIPLPELILGTITYVVIILMTIIGNTLVVVTVFTYRPLKKVQNYFLVSLACSDLAVAILVMPFHVAKFLSNGRWIFGFAICQFFTTADVMLCTSSILNLVAIALDRYWAINNALDYAHKRTLKFVVNVIIVVWVASVVISVPPIIGWNDWSQQSLIENCELNTEKAFVVFSASGSFFVPLIVMIIVYLKIFISARKRIRTNRGRSALVRIQKTRPETNNNIKEGSESEKPARKGINFTNKNRSFRCSSKRKNIIFKPQTGDEAQLVNEVIIDHNNLSFQTSSSTLPETVNIGKNTVSSPTGKNTVMFQLPSEAKSSTVASSDEVTSKKSVTDDTRNATSFLRKREKISVAKEKRAAKTIAVIIFVFTFCWFPFFCSYLIIPFCDSCYLHPKVQQAFVWLGYINSSLNPFLYGILSMDFRKGFTKIMSRILCSKKSLRTRSHKL
uniref:G_PROTEIN_RECEP_F1_2 domain-containing protein n=1 Tax=Rhabditophanes sp. KR3021 TaxID=114890 RepID=A0AC35U7M4_9BILA